MLRLIESKDFSCLTNERNVILVQIVIFLGSSVDHFLLTSKMSFFSKIFWLAFSIFYFYVISHDFLLRDTSGCFS